MVIIENKEYSKEKLIFIDFDKDKKRSTKTVIQKNREKLLKKSQLML